MNTGIFYDPLFLKHETGLHPENPDRLAWILAELQRTGLWDRCLHPACRDATVEELCLVHDPGYVRRVREMAESGGGALDPETVVSANSYAAAVRAAGAALAAVEAVLRGEMRNAFCAVRPPGHHAMPDAGMGFCIFNNVAIAAKYLRERLGVGRVAIFDWDAHHGNGTQQVFYRDGSVFYASLHLWPHWPGTGAREETGEGPGLGCIVNRPDSARRHARGIPRHWRAKSSRGRCGTSTPSSSSSPPASMRTATTPSRRWGLSRSISGN